MQTRGMSSPCSIRSATEADADAVARLACDLGYEAAPDAMRARIRGVLASAGDELFVAADSSGTAVGWLQAHSSLVIESGFRVEILGLVVSPAARRRGVGRALVAAAERWAWGVAADAVVVRSNVTRTESHAFYSGLGYATTKTQRVYKKTRSDVSAT